MNNFWIVFKKELTCCGRDPDVLIYAFLLPLILYPLSAVFVNEASLWYASMQEKNKESVYISEDSPLAGAIAVGLRNQKHFNVIDKHLAMPVSSPDVRSRIIPVGAVALITVDPSTSEVLIQAHETSSHLGTVANQIENEIRQARFKALKQKLEAKGISPDILNVFTVQRQGLKKARTAGSADGELKQLFEKLITLLATFMILMMTVIGGPASVCMMAEEHEKKTFLTTLLLPIDRLVIVIAKFLTVAVICVGGAAFNLLCMGLFVGFLLATTLGHNISVGQIYNDFQHLTVSSVSYYLGTGAIFVNRVKQFVQLPTVPEVLLMVAFFCSTGALLSAIYLCVAGYGKTVKSAQMLVSLPMIFLMALPTIAMIPGIQFNMRTALIPIANLLIMRKFENPPMLPAAIAVLEPLILVALILFLVRRNLENQVQGKRKRKTETVKAA